MSGIYIKNMELPKDKGLFVFLLPDGSVTIGGDKIFQTNAIKVSDHGRLIDADALKESIHCTDTDERKILSTRDLHIALNGWIDDRPTIIPADKETPCEDCHYEKCSIQEIGSCEVATKDGAE